MGQVKGGYAVFDLLPSITIAHKFSHVINLASNILVEVHLFYLIRYSFVLLFR